MVRQSISKIKKQYQTFLNEQGCNNLRQYLEWRMNEKTVRTAKGDQRIEPGEILTPESPVVTVTRLSVGRFHRRNQISGIIKDAIVSAGFTYNANLLRNFFIDAMEAAERHDIIKVTDDRLFWSGQTPSMQATYTKFNKQVDEEVARDAANLPASLRPVPPPASTHLRRQRHPEARTPTRIIDN